MLNIVGIDIAKASFDVAIWSSDKAIYLGKYPNTAKGFKMLEIELEKQAEEASDIKLIMEPTGKYEQHLFFFAHQKGWQVALPNPLWVKDWARGSGKRGKTDRADAKILAQYGFEKNPPCQMISEEDVEYLDDLLGRQVDLEKMIRAEKNRLSQYEGTRPRSKKRIIQSLKKSIQHLERQLKQIEQEIGKVYDRNETLKDAQLRLLTVPGVGHKLVHYLVVLLSNWQRHTDYVGGKKQLTAFVGLDPQPFESGARVYKRPTISKKGDSLIRNKLYMGALGGVRGNNPLRDFYQRLVGRGKSKRLSLVAAARKILVWAWAVFNSQQVFDSAKALPNSS